MQRSDTKRHSLLSTRSHRHTRMQDKQIKTPCCKGMVQWDNKAFLLHHLDSRVECLRHFQAVLHHVSLNSFARATDTCADIYPAGGRGMPPMPFAPNGMPPFPPSMPFPPTPGAGAAGSPTNMGPFPPPGQFPPPMPFPGHNMGPSPGPGMPGMGGPPPMGAMPFDPRRESQGR